jgi:hypothetical protein
VTAIDTILQPGEPIPDDVTEVRDADNDIWELDEHGTWLTPDDAQNMIPGNPLRYGPLTVTAVREQPAEPEPQQADASPLLDLVRQHGQARWNECAARDRARTDWHKASTEADALLARIAALVPQQPVQARDGIMLWWIHSCGEVNAWVEGDQPGPYDTCGTRDCTGPWRPLLVAAPDGDRTPEQRCPSCGSPNPGEHPTIQLDYDGAGPRDEDGEHVVICKDSFHGAPDILAQVMAELGVDRAEDALERLSWLKRRVGEQGREFVVATAEAEHYLKERNGMGSPHRRYMPHQDGAWQRADDGRLFLGLGAVLDAEPKGVQLELAPPREPRTWKQIEHAPEGLRRVEVRQPDGRQFVAARRQDGHWVATIAHPDPENAELDETYTWGELLGEGDVTEVLDREAGL